MEALALRSTSRSFASDELPAQTLSNLLWAAWGINRPTEGKRTAPSASNWRETDIYVVMKSGAYVYDAPTNSLKPVVSGDYHALTGKQPFVKDVPITLVFVADAARMKAGELSESIKWADTAFISENVYLFAASEGLATGIRANVDRPALAKALLLKGDQAITMAQSVGFPEEVARDSFLASGDGLSWACSGPSRLL
jgi:nitroreductase